MRGPEQGRVADPGDRTTAVPVLQQRAAEHVLADPLHDQPFGFGRAWQARGLALELGQGRVRQTDPEPVGAIKGVVEAALVGEAVDGETGPEGIEAPGQTRRRRQDDRSPATRARGRSTRLATRARARS